MSRVLGLVALLAAFGDAASAQVTSVQCKAIRAMVEQEATLSLSYLKVLEGINKDGLSLIFVEHHATLNGLPELPAEVRSRLSEYRASIQTRMNGVQERDMDIFQAGLTALVAACG